MTRKVPLAEAKTTIGKQKYLLRNACIYPITEILWKTASSHKISLKLHNRVLSCGQNDF